MTYSCYTQREILSIQGSNSTDVEGLYPGTEYTFSISSVTDDRNQRASVTMSVYTSKCFDSNMASCITGRIMFNLCFHYFSYNWIGSFFLFAEPVPPEKIKIDHVSSESVSLSWDKRVGVPEACLVTCSCNGEDVQKITTESNTLTFSSLSPGVKYSFHVSTVLKNGTQSMSAVTYVRTSECIKNFHCVTLTGCFLMD